MYIRKFFAALHVFFEKQGVLQRTFVYTPDSQGVQWRSFAYTPGSQELQEKSHHVTGRVPANFTAAKARSFGETRCPSGFTPQLQECVMISMLNRISDCRTDGRRSMHHGILLKLREADSRQREILRVLRHTCVPARGIPASVPRRTYRFRDTPRRTRQFRDAR